MLGKVRFEPFGKLPPCQQDSPPAACAFEPDICAQARDNPLEGTAGMLFSQAQVIVETQVG